MPDSPPLLLDTTSLLRARLDTFNRIDARDGHVLAVLDSLILFDHIILDGPSVERNSGSLRWLSDVDRGIEVLEVSPEEESALYRSAEVLARQMRSLPGARRFLQMHMPREFALEVGQSFSPSTYWSDLERRLHSEDLQRLRRVFEETFGPNVPHSGAAFVAMARTLYYLCLQESIGSSLLLDPMKRFGSELPSTAENARRILDLFDRDVGDAFRERKRRWLGDNPRKLRIPILASYVGSEALRRNWSIGRVILSMRQSREVQLFRHGLNELQDAIECDDSASLDAVFADLDAAMAAWSKQLGVGYKHTDIAVSVSLPFVGIGTTLPLPRLIRRSTSSKLLVFIGELLAHSELAAKIGQSQPLSLPLRSIQAKDTKSRLVEPV